MKQNIYFLLYCRAGCMCKNKMNAAGSCRTIAAHVYFILLHMNTERVYYTAQ